MLYFCRHSFWTSMRIIGDLPHALAAVIVTGLSIVAVEAGLSRRRGSVARAAAEPLPGSSPRSAPTVWK